MFKIYRNTTGKPAKFHGIIVPELAYFGFDNDKPFASTGAHPIPGVVFVYRISRNGNWHVCREQGALARALHRRYWADHKTDCTAADREARFTEYTSRSEVHNPTGNRVFT